MISRFGFGQLRDIKTGITLRFATRDELIASIPTEPGRGGQPIEVVVDGEKYTCTVHYQQ